MMLIKEIFSHEVYPALGCTEPISCAYAAACAAAMLEGSLKRLQLKVDPATYRNGAAVTVPNSGGRKGNLIAAVMGAILARPELKLEILNGVTPQVISQAAAMMQSGNCQMTCLNDRLDFRVEATVESDEHSARCVLAIGHTNIEVLEVDGHVVHTGDGDAPVRGDLPYREVLRHKSLLELLALPDCLDESDLAFLRHGIEMNLALADRGIEVRRSAYQLNLMKEEGFASDDMFFQTRLKVASAVDARMAGIPLAAMTSGGSGNQGILVTLITSGVGRAMGVPEKQILKSLALAHIINAYIKCFVGELAVICGCAIAAGVAGAIAIVYQQAGNDIDKMTMAVNNVIGDLGGMICDGAKPGCAMKAITSADSAIRSSLMALKGYGLSAGDGIVGRSAEESIRNLGRIVLEGMSLVNPTVLKILRNSHTSNIGV